MKNQGILFVGNFLSAHTGTRSVAEELSPQLSSRGWGIIQTSHQRSRVIRLADMFYSVVRYRNEYQVACVDVFSGLAFVWAELVVRLLRLLKKPMILALRGGGLVEFAHRYPARITRLLRQGKIIVTPSLFLQAGLMPQGFDIRYLPNAVEVGRYKFMLRHHPSPKIVWLRAFHSIYQPELAIKTMSLLVDEYKELTLTMIGPDKLDGSLPSALELAKRLQVLSRINIVGPIPKSEVPVWLAKGDIFLNTTRYESFGVSVLEAALVGLPIVTTNVGELPFLWQDKKNALLVSVDDPREMADAIRKILSEPGLAESLSKNARQNAEGFDWANTLPKWENIFLEAASD